MPKAFAKYSSRKAQKADKYMGVDKEVFQVPLQDPEPAGCRQQAGVAQMR